MDDASSVFDASILTGPAANYPVADGFDRGRERDCSTGDIPHVFTPPLGNPNGVAGSAAFGTITTAGDPRVVQLAVKLLF
jgi:hypothetical protein